MTWTSTWMSKNGDERLALEVKLLEDEMDQTPEEGGKKS